MAALLLFGLGLLTGATIGAPLGPTGALCASLALEGRRHDALLGAAGSALALGLWAAVAMAGATTLADRLEPWLGLMRASSGVVLLALGILLWSRARRAEDAAAPAGRKVGARGVFLGCFGVVLTNPTGLLLVALLSPPVAAIGGAAWQAVVFVPLGVLAGGFAIFHLLISYLDRRKARISARGRAMVLRAFAGFIGVVGGVSLLSLLLRS